MVPTILIVEADPAVRFQITSALRRWGYRAIEARDGCDAVAKMGSEAVDLALLAERLPGGNGVELGCQLRQAADDKGIPVIVLTENERESRLTTLAAGADGCLSKPVLLSELIARTRGMFHGQPG